MSGFIQALPDCCNTAVHHIGRCYHIRSCLYVGKCCFCKKIQCFVIIHIMTAENAAMAMGSVLTHAYICYIIKLRKFLFCNAKSSLNDPLRIIGTAAHFILMVRNTKKHHTSYTGFGKLLQFIRKTVQAVTVLPGHGRNFFFLIFSFHYEHRIHKRRFIHSCLTYHLTKVFTAS